MAMPRLPAARRLPGPWVTSLAVMATVEKALGDPSPNISWDVMD